MVSEYETKKYEELQDILSHENPKLNHVKVLGICHGGFLKDSIRQKAWPLLGKIDLKNIPAKPDHKKLEKHKEYEQVVRDVDRSLKRFPPGLDEESRMMMHDQLVDVIMRVLVRNLDLCYYQGYHDICVTFLIVLGEDVAFSLMEKLSNTHLADFMCPTMEPTTHLLGLIYVILEEEAPDLLAMFKDAQLEPYFAVSWVITWFGHVLGDLKRILRVYDFFISTNYLMPIYLSTAIVLHRREEVKKCPLDYALMHHLLMHLPDNLPLEALICDSCRLFIKHPPEIILSKLPPPKTSASKSTQRFSPIVFINAYLRFSSQVLSRRSRYLAVGAILVLLLSIFIMFIINIALK